MSTHTKEEKAARRTKFEGVYTVIRDELVKHFEGEGMPKDAVEWFHKVCSTSNLPLMQHAMANEGMVVLRPSTTAI